MRVFLSAALVLTGLWQSTIAASPSVSVSPTLELRLWDGPAPGAPENPEPEKKNGDHISHISIPTLTAYLPPPDKATGTAIIMCSGGGYTVLAPEKVGKGAAAEFVPKGIAVFSLKYRLKPPSTDVRRDSLMDAKRALRIVRSHAAEWHIRPDRIGVVGFSAGSNVTLNVACNNDKGNPASNDPIERQSSRPDFIGLFCYWGGTEGAKIDSNVPVAFIAHAKDDHTAPYAGSEKLVSAWKGANVPVHFESYETGDHMGFNFPPKNADWPGKFLVWLEQQKLYIKK